MVLASFVDFLALYDIFYDVNKNLVLKVFFRFLNPTVFAHSGKL